MSNVKDNCWALIREVWSAVDKYTKSLEQEQSGRVSKQLWWGPPGTGKTEAANGAATFTNRERFNVTIDGAMQYTDIVGRYGLVASNGGTSTVWQDGPALRWLRTKHSVLIINEIDQYGPDLIGVIHALTEDEPRIILPTGETVTATGGQICVATMNPHPDEALTEAIRSRFPVRIRIDKVNPKAIMALPEDLRDIAPSMVTSPRIEERIDLRTWFAFAALRTNCSEETAALACFGRRSDELLNAIRLRRSQA